MKMDNESVSHCLRPPAPATTVEDDGNNRHGHGDATVSQTIANMAKTCMGTGCLALPFAAKQGGILLHVFGLIAVAIWNTITVELLCKCYDLTIEAIPGENTPGDAERCEQGKRLLKRSSTSATGGTSEESIRSYQSIHFEADLVAEPAGNVPPKGTTTLANLAWYALGEMGANILDVVMILYLIGVVVAYMNAMRSFLADTFFSTGVGIVDSLLLVAFMGPLSVVPHTGYLAKASVMGLAVLLATFVVIAWYGFVGENVGDNRMNDDSWTVLTTGLTLETSQNVSVSSNADESSIWFPRKGMAGASQWFGCVVFGFGITPLAFNFREAMQEPQYLLRATKWAVLVVALSYVVIGLGLLWTYPNIHGDVLHELPTEGWLPALTRLSMVVVVLVTAPLLIVPCGDLIERRLLGLRGRSTSTPQQVWYLQVVVRWGICITCAAISTMVPGFVDVLSFVGCCCVALVGFCLPPFLHLLLSLQRGTPLASTAIDVALLLWGIAATAVSTVYTYQEIAAETP